MGGGINGCLNIAGWNHLFRPNSQAAQDARANCVDHWMRQGGNQGSTRGPLKLDSPGEEPSSNITNYVIIAGILAVLYYVFKNNA